MQKNCSVCIAFSTLSSVFETSHQSVQSNTAFTRKIGKMWLVEDDTPGVVGGVVLGR